MAPRMSKPELYNKLISSYKSAPHPSFKVTNYFPIYVDLFGHLVGTSCVFIETGVLHGGSLFMWRSWLGDQARIIGIDLNPGATRWREHGFEIYIGDQGSPSFWNESLSSIGVTRYWTMVAISRFNKSLPLLQQQNTGIPIASSSSKTLSQVI